MPQYSRVCILKPSSSWYTAMPNRNNLLSSRHFPACPSALPRVYPALHCIVGNFLIQFLMLDVGFAFKTLICFSCHIYHMLMDKHAQSEVMISKVTHQKLFDFNDWKNLKEVYLTIKGGQKYKGLQDVCLTGSQIRFVTIGPRLQYYRPRMNQNSF